MAASLRATYLAPLVLQSISLMNIEKLHSDILLALAEDPVAQEYSSKSKDSQWITGDDNFLQQDGKIYIPSSGNLCMHVLQFKYDHVLSSHFGQNKTLELVH